MEPWRERGIIESYFRRDDPDMRSPLAFIIVSAVCTAGCQREQRELRLDPPVAASLDQIALMPNGISGAPPLIYFALDKPYESNAYNLSEGKRLYSWFGCKSCHADGEGGVGPGFLDGWWNYGPEMVSIFASIRDGRPHGMPAFRDKMTTEQMWQLAGYVQTIGAYSAKTAATSRNDEKQTRPAENRAPAAMRFDPGPTPVHPDQGPNP
jgi:cytochrome c oxidase cbb3-type subunit 3